MTTRVSTAFKFRIFPWFFVAWVAINLIGMTLGVIWIIREGVVGGLLFMLVTISLFGFLVGMAVFSLSEIVIDDHAIARRILGITWQTIRWNDVRSVRTFRITDFSGSGKLRVFNIYPVKRSRFRSGVMMFNE